MPRQVYRGSTTRPTTTNIIIYVLVHAYLFAGAYARGFTACMATAFLKTCLRCSHKKIRCRWRRPRPSFRARNHNVNQSRTTCHAAADHAGAGTHARIFRNNTKWFTRHYLVYVWMTRRYGQSNARNRAYLQAPV